MRRVGRMAVGATLYALSLGVGACSPDGQNPDASPAQIFYAAQSGRRTLDGSAGGGTPFASALIELLGRPNLTSEEFDSALVSLTGEMSRGFQVPEALAPRDSVRWTLAPIPPSMKRVALVFVYSDYRDAGVPSLPGAARDLDRVSTALASAGFEVETLIDPTERELSAGLRAFSKLARDAEFAVIYTTGHGFEHEGQVYLMPNDYPFDEGAESLAAHAIEIPDLADFLSATEGNLLFFGGCREFM